MEGLKLHIQTKICLCCFKSFVGTPKAIKVVSHSQIEQLSVTIITRLILSSRHKTFILLRLSNCLGKIRKVARLNDSNKYNYSIYVSTCFYSAYVVLTAKWDLFVL